MANDYNPWYPHMTCEKGTYCVRWGWGGRLFITALLVVIGGSGLTAYRLHAGEEANKLTEKNIKILDGNLRVLDEQTRLNAQAAGLANKQLRALLEHQGITKRIEPPKVPESKLKELE